MIAETGNPHFVLARSVTCTASDFLTLMIALVLLESEFRMAKEFNLNILDPTNSSHGWSTKLVLLTQTVGVLVAAISPSMRWLMEEKLSITNRRWPALKLQWFGQRLRRIAAAMREGGGEKEKEKEGR